MIFKKNITFILTISILVGGCQAQGHKAEKDIDELQKNNVILSPELSYTSIVDFKYAAKTATPGVVHIKSTYLPDKRLMETPDYQDDFHGIPDPFKDFFQNDPFFRHFEFRFPESPQYPMQPQQTSGSGVILTNDGYIVTNNHVIINADEIEVTLSDRHSYKAIVIGSDPQTDLALLKIDEKDLSYIMFGNSDSVEIGEWVVAVGNPFNLASTVTAGIVSAKTRNINILRDEGAVESFIQTDAAVNPGNSGGALVTLNGKLIGINTAIATPTGVYAGYAFAIPSDIVKKVVNDLINYGTVQRAFLGVIIRDLNNELSKELNISTTTGVYVDSLFEDGAAKEAGINKKDVIVSIDGKEIINAPSLQEIIARKRPGEKVKLTVIRNKKLKEVFVTLKNRKGNTDIVKKESYQILKELGVELEEITKLDKKKYDVNNGVKVSKLYTGTLKRYTEIREGFIITSVNNKPINSIVDFVNEVEMKKGGILIEGKYPGDPTIWYYAFGM